MELSYVVAAARRFAWVVLLGVLGGTLLGFVASSSGTESHQATTVLRVEPASTGPLAARGSNNYVDNEALVVTSTGNAQRVADRLGQSLGDVQRNVRADARNGVDAIDVVVTRSNPAEAIELANLFGQEYVAGRVELNNQLIDSEIAVISARSAEVVDRLGELENEIAETPAELSPTENLLFQQRLFERNSLNSTLLAEAQAIADLETARNAIRDRVLEPATSTEVIGGSTPILLPAGSIAGAVLGVIGAILLAAASGSVVDVLQTEQNLGARVLGSMPRRRSLRDLGPLIAERRGRPVPLVDEICVRLEAAMKRGSALTVAVVGSQMGAGASTVAAAIAQRSAERGHPTLLADGDSTNPEISETILQNPTSGLAEVIHAPELESSEIDVFPLGPNLDALGLGSDELRPVAGLSSGFALENLGAFGHEIVLIDCGDLLRTASSSALTRGADVVVVVSPLRQETVSNLVSIRGVLDSMKGLVLGVSNSPRRSLWPIARPESERGSETPGSRLGIQAVARPRVDESDQLIDDDDVDGAVLAAPEGTRWARRR